MENSFHLRFPESKYSYNQTPGIDSNRSPTSELVSLRRVKRKGSEQKLLTKVVPNNLNMLK